MIGSITSAVAAAIGSIAAWNDHWIPCCICVGWICLVEAATITHHIKGWIEYWRAER